MVRFSLGYWSRVEVLPITIYFLLDIHSIIRNTVTKMSNGIHETRMSLQPDDLQFRTPWRNSQVERACC